MTMKIVCPCCGGDHVAEVQSLDFSCSDCGGATLIDFTDPVEIVVENKVFLNDGTSSSDFVALDHENGRITIKTDVDLAKTLAFVFSVLYEVSLRVRSKMFHARSLAAAHDRVETEKRQLAFKDESLKVFSLYKQQLDNGIDKKTAFRFVQKHFSLRYGETKILLVSGRKEFKQHHDCS